MQLTLVEASERLGVTPRRVRAQVERGQLPAVRRGRMWLTTDDAVDAFRSGADTLGIRRDGEPFDLYATTRTAERLIHRSGATPDPDGLLYLHILDPDLVLPELTERERTVLAWCDLADRADPAADVAALRLWPDSLEVPQLADVVRGHDTIPYTALRGFTDWLRRHPNLTHDAITTRPDPTGDPTLDSLYAAVAETAAADVGIDPPPWAAEVRSAGAPDRLGPPRAADDVPRAFVDRGIPYARDTFWHR